MEKEEKESLKKAGEIAKKAVDYAKTIVKKGSSLLEIAEKIESKIIELGGKPAFPVNLSINEVAAHATPEFNESSVAHGLLKVDIGVHINGFVADTAFSVDLENSEENKKLIEAAESALKKALEIVNKKTKIREIGATIEKEIKNRGFHPIRNLSGHSIERFNLHAGMTVPNYDNAQEFPIGLGVFAIEPFATTGQGAVRDGRQSGIYGINNFGNIRDAFARRVLEYIKEEYGKLPFCSRWLVKRFGSRAVLALKRIEEAGLAHQYQQLIERGAGKVAQAENTIIISEKDTAIIVK